MTISPGHEQFVEYVVDLSQVIGPVYSKRMFGGHGIFLEGVMFGLVFNSTLYFKVDSDSRERYVSRGLDPFSYERKGKIANLNYYQAPEEVLDDLEIMRDWSSYAFEVAIKAAAKRKAD